MSNKSGTSSQVISLPQGGGALKGIGEKFSPDLFTGTGNFTIPITLPAGRSGFQPQLNLVYSTGAGNGPFGLGWSLSVPGVSRKTSKGLPRYQDADPANQDIFLLSGAEDLVPVEDTPAFTRYRPRTEGLFARLIHHHTAGSSYWEVNSKDGLVSTYGYNPADTPTYTPEWAVPNASALITKPGDASRIFAWKLTTTLDPFQNRIEYLYRPSKTSLAEESSGHASEQPLLQQIRYVDYTDASGKLGFLVTVTFDYEDRPDHFSDYRAGFEIRTLERCHAIRVATHFGPARTVREYRFTYDNTAPNGVSLLQQIDIIGYDDAGNAYDRQPPDPQFELKMPPVTFGYTGFKPKNQAYKPVTGAQLPAQSLASPALELADLNGDGLPDILEMNGTVRYWRNLGGGRFDLPRSMKQVPAGLKLADSGVQLMDIDGDARIDLLATVSGLAGYFPLEFTGEWDQKSFRPYKQLPTFNLEDPEVKLVDLDGDGRTDILRSSTRMECYFNRPETGGWGEMRLVTRQALDVFPDVHFSDARVKWGDMTGDGLQDILLVYDGSVQYWPNLGYGSWGKRIFMKNSPTFKDLGYTFGYDPKRLLIGDVDGDGLADMVYIGDREVTLWINQSGSSWSAPIPIDCAPPVSDMDAVRLVDLLGSGTSGVLWSANASPLVRSPMNFLDFTGGVKPYLLESMTNHLGAETKVTYRPSTAFYLKDQVSPKTRWKTSLPFPVQVVATVEVIDGLSKGKLTTQYRYHHGYWDGAEREFRGFGMVEQLDTEMFADYHQPGVLDFAPVPETVSGEMRFSPPMLTKTWFHQGPIGPEFGNWKEDEDWSADYWPGDPPLLERRQYTTPFLNSLAGGDPDSRRIRRDALRSLRGSILRTELYAQDGSPRAERPYTVSESQYGLQEVEKPAAGVKRQRIFFPHLRAQRTTQWERGSDPMTQFSFTRYTDVGEAGAFDPFGRPLAQTSIACPRGWRGMADQPAEPYLATRTRTRYAEPLNPAVYHHDRVASTTSFEISGTAGKRVANLAALADTSAELALFGQSLNFYDGPALVGLPLGQTGPYGALTRGETLVFTSLILQEAYGAQIPPYLEPTGSPVWPPGGDYPAEFRALLPQHAGYIFHPGSADKEDPRGYFAHTARSGYDFQLSPLPGRGLVLETWGPLHDSALNPDGHRTRISYDAYQFLPTVVTDAAGLVMRAEYNPRVLQPSKVTDPNGNTSTYTFTPLGLLETVFIHGQTFAEGDQSQPSVQMIYDLMAFKNSPALNPQPISVRSIRRVHHDTETGVPAAEINQTITSVEYSDGFGRLLQTRTQGEAVRFGDPRFGGGEAVLPARQSDGPGADVTGVANSDPNHPNVVVSGWQIYDNKGRVVEKYEPFFSTGWDYNPPDDLETGQKVMMFYDPRGQVILTHHPDQSIQRVIYGVPGSIAAPNLATPEIFEPTPWEAYTYDPNDNAGRTHPGESAGYQHHWNTPSSIRIDALGRVVEAIERNRDDLGAALQAYHTRTTYDIRGNVLTITDVLGRDAFRHVYDNANRALRLESIDAGVRTSVLDAAGKVIEQRDGRAALVLHSYDGLNRPLRLWARDGAGQALTLRERLEYGDGGTPTQPPAERAAQQQANRLGRLHQYYDEAGLITFERYDFKGNLLDKTRQVLSDAALLAVFQGPPPGWAVPAAPIDWTTPAAVALEPSGCTTSTHYDALNRTTQILYPQDVEGQRRALKPRYNHAGALEAVTLEWTAPGGINASQVFVQRIAYNAKGQRVLIAYGNGRMTRYAYDAHTFRLLRMRTEAYSTPPSLTYHHTGQPLQDNEYDYDLAGNIRHITERVPGAGIHDNPDGALIADPVLGALVTGGNALLRAFEYDALYRLRQASGRESSSIAAPRPWSDDPRDGFNAGNHGTPNQGNAPFLTRAYQETYNYDPAGNLVTLQHSQGAGAGWTRHFGMGGLNPQQWTLAWQAHFNAPANWADSPSNQLTHVGDNQTSFPPTHIYDANGNLIRENTARHFEWDYANRLRAFRVQTDGSEPSVYAIYLYDAGGQRVKKLVRKQGGRVEVTVYIDGIFEYQRIVHAGVVEENNTLHVMDNQSRIALVRVGSPFTGDPAPAVTYHLGDHLGSSTLVVDDAGNWVNREEYTPYGETSFGSFAHKRYRFTGKERDEESGLNYHGARYYASWLVRWTSCDPIGVASGLNLYSYVKGNPIRLIDLKGTTEEEVVGSSGAGGTASVPVTSQGPNSSEVVGPYSKKGPAGEKSVRGDHVHQVASRTDAPGGSRRAAAQYGEALSHSTKDPTYNDKGGQRVESAMNRTAWGENMSCKPGEKSNAEGEVVREGVVEIEAVGETTVGRSSSATPSTWFENMKSFYKLREAGKSPDEAYDLVCRSADQLASNNANPKRVPDAPKGTPRPLQSGQDLSPEMPARSIGSGLPPASSSIGEFSQAFGEAMHNTGKVMTYVAVVESAENIANAVDRDIKQGTGGEQTARTVAHEAGGWAGALWGAGEGAAFGLWCGPGAEICSPLFGLAGGLIGYYSGSGSVDSFLFITTGH